MQTILDCGEDLNLTDAEAARLAMDGIIYRCQQEGCLPCFHIDPSCTWDSVDSALAQLRTKAATA